MSQSDGSPPGGVAPRAADELAQVNIARLLEPLDSARLADFVAGLAPVNALADQAPGFVWRLQTEQGDATAVTAFAWDVDGSAGVIVNLSVWRDLPSLRAFVYAPGHRAVLRRRREWFVPVREAVTALWRVPPGHRPSTQEAEAAVRRLRADGSSSAVFGLHDDMHGPDRRGAGEGQV